MRIIPPYFLFLYSVIHPFQHGALAFVHQLPTAFGIKSRSPPAQVNYYSTLEDPPFSVAASVPARRTTSRFEERMWNVIQSGRKVSQNKSGLVHDSMPNLYKVEGVQDFHRLVTEEQKQIVVVRWHAPWCKACQAVTPHFQRLARQLPTVKFVEVSVTPKNAALYQSFNIPSLPFGYIYYPSRGIVEKLRITRPLMKDFERILKSYVDGSCLIPPNSDAETGLLLSPYVRN